MQDSSRQSHSSSAVSIVSRLDHLDFIMKYLEGKQSLLKWGSSSSSSSAAPAMPMSLAAREAYFKGSLLDRVVALENRLFQLCMERESSSTSTSTSAGSSSSQASGSGYASSKDIPIFNIIPNNPRHHHPPLKEEPLPSNSIINAPPQLLQEKARVEKQKKKRSSTSLKKKPEKSKGNNDENTCKDVKKAAPPIRWPRMKLLGCS